MVKVKKERLGKWDNVYVPLSFWKLCYIEHGFKKNRPEYDQEGYFRFGGREFPRGGNNWSGVDFEGIYRIHINGLRTVREMSDFLLKENYIPVMDIEKFKKTIQKDDGTDTTFEYFIFTPKRGAEKEAELVVATGYFKTNYTSLGNSVRCVRRLVADDAEEIASTSNKGRTGRFGSNSKMYIVRGEYEVTERKLSYVFNYYKLKQDLEGEISGC